MKNAKQFDQSLKTVNSRLKAANLRVSIERKGGSLYARATLPPPPGSSKTAPYQQHLSLNLKASSAGLKRAEAEAKKIGAALDLKQFSWTDYGRGQPKAEQRKVKEWILSYEQNYFNKTERNPTTKMTFKKNHLTYLKRLPQDQGLTSKLLEDVIKSTVPNSYTRKRMCSCFKRFGKLAEINTDFITKELSGTYCSWKPAPRKLPTDNQIVDAFYQIPNLNWAWVYGMVATFGLRPHEVFHLDMENLEQGGLVLKVLEDTKTGYREVRPLYPEWVDQFNLRKKQLPKVTIIGQPNGQLGSKVSQAFRRYQLPFPPYHLRHRYAVRCIQFNIPVSMAAKWMGHSVEIHTKVYQAWLDKSDEEMIFVRALSQPNRPQPPTLPPMEQRPEDEDGRSKVA